MSNCFCLSVFVCPSVRSSVTLPSFESLAPTPPPLSLPFLPSTILLFLSPRPPFSLALYCYIDGVFLFVIVFCYCLVTSSSVVIVCYCLFLSFRFLPPPPLSSLSLFPLIGHKRSSKEKKIKRRGQDRIESKSLSISDTRKTREKGTTKKMKKYLQQKTKS